jgi:hypothetical protein
VTEDEDEDEDGVAPQPMFALPVLFWRRSVQVACTPSPLTTPQRGLIVTLSVFSRTPTARCSRPVDAEEEAEEEEEDESAASATTGFTSSPSILTLVSTRPPEASMAGSSASTMAEGPPRGK